MKTCTPLLSDRLQICLCKKLGAVVLKLMRHVDQPLSSRGQSSQLGWFCSACKDITAVALCRVRFVFCMHCMVVSRGPNYSKEARHHSPLFFDQFRLLNIHNTFTSGTHGIHLDHLKEATYTPTSKSSCVATTWV